MSVADRRRQDVDSSMAKLSLSTSPNPASKSKKPSQPAPDSWEDADLSSDSSGPATPTARSSAPLAPPPTPSSPSASFDTVFENPYTVTSSSAAGPSRGGSAGGVRPEKQTAVASRMIAGALGVRTPKKTEEMRVYEKAVKDKEKKRIDGEREAKRVEEERTREAREKVWED